MTPTVREKHITDTFNSFVTEAGERFPALKGRLVVMDMETLDTYGVHGLDYDALNLTERSIMPYLSWHGNVVDVSKNRAERSSYALHDKRSGLNIILFNDSYTTLLRDINPEAAARQAIHLLDHELGHLGIEDAGADTYETIEEKNLAESIADAYAILRHYQRAGLEEDCVHMYVTPVARAARLIFTGASERNHFTAFVTDEIVRRKNELDIMALSPEETAQLAHAFAVQYSPTKKVLRGLSRAFSPVQEAQANNDPQGAVQKLINITLDPRSSAAVFQAGAIWLRAFANGEIRHSGADLSDQEKADLNEKLDAREKSLAAAAPLLGTAASRWKGMKA